MEFTYKDIKFKLDFSFILVLSFAVFLGYGETARFIAFSLCHEIGHLFFLIIFKEKIYEFRLSFFGFGIKYCNKLSAAEDFIVTLAGPLVNLLLYFVLRDEINLLLFIVNMLPVMPLDGGRIIDLVFPKASAYISLLFLILLSLLSVYLLFEYKIISLILISAYLLIYNLRYL